MAVKLDNYAQGSTILATSFPFFSTFLTFYLQAQMGLLLAHLLEKDSQPATDKAKILEHHTLLPKKNLISSLFLLLLEAVLRTSGVMLSVLVLVVPLLLPLLPPSISFLVSFK